MTTPDTKPVTVKILPTAIWIEYDIFGARHVVVQHEGMEAFTFATFNYQYGYTDNASTYSAAMNLARSLGATEPIEQRSRQWAADVDAATPASAAEAVPNLKLPEGAKIRSDELVRRVTFVFPDEQRRVVLDALKGWSTPVVGPSNPDGSWQRMVAEKAFSAPKEVGISASEAASDTEFCWLVELFLPEGNSLGSYHTGFTDLSGNSRSTPDPFKAKRYSKADAEAVAANLGHTLSGTWKAIEHGFATPPPAPQPPNANCPIKCNSMEQCSGACDFMEAAPQPAVTDMEMLEIWERQSEARFYDPDEKRAVVRFGRTVARRAAASTQGGGNA